MYEAEDEKDVIEDMELLAEGMQLLQYDYLGGSGSRGYGRVIFKDVYAEVVVGEIGESIIDKCNETLQTHIAN